MVRNFLFCLGAFYLISCGQPEVTVDYKDLVQRNDTYFLKFSNEPFAGKTTGQWQGLIKSGKWEGKVNIYYDEGTLLSEIEYKNGIKHGEHRAWCMNGNPQWQVQYVDGRKHGLQTSFWCNGSLSSEMHFTAGKISSKEINGYHENGQSRLKFNLKDGLMEGRATRHYENGILMQEAFWQADLLDGTCKIYEDDGLLNYDLMFSKGALQQWKRGKAAEKNPFNQFDIIDLNNPSERVLRIIKRCSVSRLAFEE